MVVHNLQYHLQPSAFQRQRQVSLYEFKASLGYAVRPFISKQRGVVHSGGFTHVILTLEKQRQEDCCKFKAIVVNTVNPGSASTT